MRKNFRILLLNTYILSLLIYYPVQSQSSLKTVQKSIVSGGDDAEEEASGKMNLISSGLELVYHNSTTGNQVIGLRFTNMTIPANAIISKAYIQFTSKEVNSGGCNLAIQGQAADNAPGFSTVLNNISSRVRTNSRVTWSPAGWSNINEAKQAQATPDLKRIVQEIVNRNGWKSGNAMAFILTGTGKRVAQSFEGSAAGAPKLIIEYATKTGPFPVEKNAVWKYHDQGKDLGTAWTGVGYNDSGWKLGAGVLGYGDPVNTTLSFGPNSADKWITTYFRHHFEVKDASIYQNLIFNIRRDDGAVVYLNGVEQFRTNMPTGSVNFQTQALRAVGGSDETRYYTFKVPINQLRSGVNVVTVSVHQDQPSSSDMTFDMQITGELKTNLRTSSTGAFPIPKNSVWHYHDQGTDLGTAWTATTYDHSSWKSGKGVLGYGDPVSTTLSFGPSSTNKHITYYFRHDFNVTDASIYQNLIFNIRRDDGAVVYLNGVEQFRTNMPTGTINFKSTASNTVGGSDESKYFTFKVPVTQLKSGYNVVSVSVHQDAASSSDMTFDMEVTGELKTTIPVLSTGTFPVSKKSVWRYHDQGTDLGTAWTAPTYDHSSWKTGAGILGYGDPVTTTLSFGPSSTNKYIAYYFRHDFEMPDASIYQNLIFNIRRDDGAVVYLNGVEQFRTNMPTGTINFKSTALKTVGGSEETTYFTFKLPSTQLKNGFNVVAVSVHQDAASSSDMTFDMEVLGELKSVAATDCGSGNSDKIGCFTSVKPATQTELFVFPESHSFQQIAKSGVTKYTSGGTGTIPGGNDFTAYVAKNNSSKEGLLSINHENHPGGVSLLNIKLNEQKLLWEVNGIHRMDFSNIAGTSRNCSGGITPWGTIITSEETFSIGDANGDGYQDYGWNVEFDPVSGKVKDYNGDGIPDKLWAMGRMRHENVAVGKDGITVYQGEDGGTSCVYKYIANTKGNLSAGKLYVLKRNISNPTLGDWILVPNTTKSDRNNTSSIAGSLGGTNWSNVEDIEWGPDGKIYFTSKGTGTIWRFKDNGTSVSGIEAWVTNQQYPIKHQTGTQMESFGLGIDNLVFDGDGNLWALQDDDKGNKNRIWVIKPDHTPSNPKIELFAIAPLGSEPTGLTFTPDFKYGFLSIQHPNTANSQTQLDASGATIRHNAPTTIVFARKENLGNSSTMLASNLKSSGIFQDENSETESTFQLKIYPNPFKSDFNLNLSLEEESHILIELITVEGVIIREIMNNMAQKGMHSFNITGLDFLQNGVYILRINLHDQIITKRIIQIKEQ